MASNRPLPVVVCIDVEPDERTEVRGAVDWRGFEESIPLFQDLRQQLMEHTEIPVHFSWFLRMDPQIETVYGTASWVTEKYRSQLNTLIEQGDEIGIHVHSWKWLAEEDQWIAEYSDQSWIEHCLRTGLHAFRSAFSRNSESFRFGDRWMNQATIRMLEEMGVRYDLTVEPGQTSCPYEITRERHNGCPPDYSNALRTPYRPSRKNFLSRGWWPRNLWVLPLSTGFLPAIHFDRPSQDPPVCIAMNLCFSPMAFSAVLDQSISQGWLAPVARTDLAIVAGQRKDCEENFNRLLELARSQKTCFITPEELVRNNGFQRSFV